MPVKAKPIRSDQSVFDPGEAMTYLGLSWNTIKKEVRAGNLEVKRVGKTYLFTMAFMDNYLNSERKEARAFVESILLRK